MHTGSDVLQAHMQLACPGFKQESDLAFILRDRAMCVCVWGGAGGEPELKKMNLFLWQCPEQFLCNNFHSYLPLATIEKNVKI